MSHYDRAELESQLMKAVAQHGDLLQSYPHVVGIGIGLGAVEGRSGRHYVVKVFVDRMPDLRELPPDRHIPATVMLHLGENRWHETPVIVEELGELRAD